MKPTKPSQILKQSATPAFLITNLTNIRYLSGIELSAGFMLVLPRSLLLFVDGRYEEAAKKSAYKTVKVLPIEQLAKRLKQLKKCGFESDDVSVDVFASMKKKYKNTKFIQKVGVIEEFRRSKDAKELDLFAKAQSITTAVIRSTPKLLKVGVTEIEVAWKLTALSRAMGSDRLAFDPIVAFGKNSSRPHHHPGENKLRAGDIVQIDFGARYKGYCADQSAVFFTAKPTPKQHKVYQAVERAKNAAIVAVCEGILTSDLDTIARAELKKENLEQYFTHALGHGVGLDIHEGVTVSSKQDGVPLKKGEIITIEPGVYIPGKFGMRLEEEVVVT